MAGQVRFSVDPMTNSEDPERRRAYGLTAAPPWADGGAIFINFPEHLEYMPGTKGIARHHDRRRNVWEVSADGLEAGYDVESLTEPGIHLRASGRAEGERASFELSLTNRTDRTLHSIRPMLCHQYWGLKGFPEARSGNFAHTFIAVGGRPVALSDLAVERPEAYARMAQVAGCPDKHNWWAEKMGGMIEAPMDIAFTAVTAREGERKLAVFWTPGKNLLSNMAIPCIHADPYYGDLQPGATLSAKGTVIFTEAPLEALVEAFAAKATRPWEAA